MSHQKVDHVLPDILVPGLDAVFVGTVVGEKSAEKGHYYANPRNHFWLRLHQAGLTPKQLSPEDDTALPVFGLGLTDLNKTTASSSDDGVVFDCADLLLRLRVAAPAWAVFNGVGAAREYAAWAGLPQPSYGFQDWTVADSLVFVVPNSSSQNSPNRVLGGQTVVKWWQDAGQHINQARAAPGA